MKNVIRFSLALKTLFLYPDFVMNTHLTEILELPVSERIQLVGDIWDSIAAVPESVSLTDSQMTEIERRLEDYRKNPDDVVPWERVRERFRLRA